MAISGAGPTLVLLEMRPSRVPPLRPPSKELCGDRCSELADPAEEAPLTELCTAVGGLSTDTRLLADPPAGSTLTDFCWVAFADLWGSGRLSAVPLRCMPLTGAAVAGAAATGAPCTAPFCTRLSFAVPDATPTSALRTFSVLGSALAVPLCVFACGHSTAGSAPCAVMLCESRYSASLEDAGPMADDARRY